MIRINLLPPEKRKLDRTPLPVFLLIVLAVLLFAGGSAYTYLSVTIQQAKEQELAAATRKENKAKQEAELVNAKRQALDKLRNDVLNLRKVIPDKDLITTDTMQALVDLLTEHPIWIDSVKILYEPTEVQSVYKRSIDQNALRFPTIAIEIKCNSPGKNPTHAANLRRAFQQHPYFGTQFPDTNKKLSTKINIEQDYEEEKSLSFEIELFNQVK